MVLDAELARYRAIFLEPGWVSRRFQGWQCILEEPGVALLAMKAWPASRYLALCEGDAARAERVLASTSVWSPMARVTVKCFDLPWQDAPAVLRLGGRTLSIASDEQRLLNKHTFVFRLQDSEELLWGRFNQATRRKCKASERAQAAFLSVSDPQAPQLATFLARLAQVSAERGLQMPSSRMIQEVVASGAGVLHVVTEGDREVAMALIYRAGPTAYYLYGVTLDEDSQGGGHWIHWSVMRHYKALGCQWYDFGGVASLSDENGIFRFKRGFGGELVDLGAEYRWQGAVLQTALNLRQRVRAKEALT
ncbi:MAG: hypothetical protein RI907_3530 [Pseudomonadota bacterium]|jgi:hypothetical protein